MRYVFVGTTAQRVQRLSPVPVLVVRQAPLNRNGRVLIATNFSPASTTAAGAARRFFPDAMFHVLHVHEARFESRLAFAGMGDEEIQNYRRRAGRRGAAGDRNLRSPDRNQVRAQRDLGQDAPKS